jgi:serine/threonine protein kinase
VFLSERSLVVNLSDNHLHSVYGPENGTTLPKIWSGLLEQPPKSEHNRVSASLSKALPELLKQIGVARSRKHYQVGSWQLDGKPFDLGPTWQDHVARHAQLDNEVRRVRIYLVERNAVQEERASIERAAKREMQALHGINHPGIVQVDAMEQHEAGPALVFRYDPRALRLDHYLSQYGARLDVETRVGMVRQLAETIAYAHRRHLHHRALSARSVLVTPLKSFRGTEDEAWLRPHLQISDWHAASRTPESMRGSSRRSCKRRTSACTCRSRARGIWRRSSGSRAPIRSRSTSSGSARSRTCCCRTSRRRPVGRNWSTGSPPTTGCGRRRAPTRCRSSWTRWSRPPPPRSRPSASRRRKSSSNCWRPSKKR